MINRPDLEAAVAQLLATSETRGWARQGPPPGASGGGVIDDDVVSYRTFFDRLQETEASPGLLGGFRVLTLDAALTAQQEHPGHDPGIDDQPAGSLSSSWSRRFLPVASQDGDMYLIDLRSGPRHGCARHWYRDDGAVYDPEWSSLAALLIDAANAVDNGGTFDYMRLVHEGGSYEWEPA